MRRRAAVTSAAGVLVLGSLAAAQLCGFRVNTTPSMPVGVWRGDAAPAADLRRGEVVTVCLPDGTPRTWRRSGAMSRPGSVPMAANR